MIEHQKSRKFIRNNQTEIEYPTNIWDAIRCISRGAVFILLIYIISGGNFH